MKRMIILLLGVMATSWTHAYIDHRKTKEDSVEALIHSKNPPKGEALIRCYMELIRGYLKKDMQKHDLYARKTLALSYELNALAARQNALYHLGMQYYAQDEFEKAVYYYQWGVAVTDSMAGDKRYSESNVDDMRSQLYGAIGNVYNMQDKLQLAIAYYQKALPIFEKHGWLQSQTILYHNVGELFLTIGNTEEAKRNYLKAIEKGEESKDSLMPALARKGLVKIYIGENDYGRARQTAEKSYAYYHAHRQEERDDYAEILAALCRINMMEGHRDIVKAKAYASEALALVYDDMLFENKANVYSAACELAMAEKQWHTALEYGLKSIHDDSLATYSDKECYMLLAEIYTELGDKQRAKEYINKVYGVMNRYATEHYQSGLSQMEVIYETEKKQAAIAQLTKEKQYYLYGGILVAILLVLLVLLFFLYWRSIQLRKRQALLQAKLEGETTERVRIARDLHDRLGGILTALRLKMSEDDGNTDAIHLTDDAIREMRNVAHHLLPETLSRHGLRTALRDYCHTMRNVTFSFIGDEQYLDKRQEEHLYCIVYELVNNAVKSAHAEHIKVQLMADENLTSVNVSDDGKGMTLDKHNGNGLKNIKERVELMGGMMDIYTPNSGGTEINITIDNHKNPHLGD